MFLGRYSFRSFLKVIMFLVLIFMKDWIVLYVDCLFRRKFKSEVFNSYLVVFWDKGVFCLINCMYCLFWEEVGYCCGCLDIVWEVSRFGLVKRKGNNFGR